MPTQDSPTAPQGATPSRETPDPMVIEGFSISICGGELSIVRTDGVDALVKLSTGLKMSQAWDFYSRRVRITIEALDDHGETIEGASS